MTNKIKFHEYLDAKGLNCPLPILKTKVLLNKMKPNKILFVEATDPHSKVDFEAFCARTNHKIIEFYITENIYNFYIKRVEKPNKI
tara:strand:- start:449 stop:706 length:258 start_codon:yes stop_codon:yes gene_type:complete